MRPDRLIWRARPTWPRVARYRVADPRWGVALNQYGVHGARRCTIGAGVVTGRTAWSLVWARPTWRDPDA